MWLRTATGFTAHIQPREPARAAPLCSNVARALEGALQSDCSTKPPTRSGVSADLSRFTCKLPYFRSGAEGIRTPDLRRAKSGYYHRGCSPVFGNTCKIASLLLEAFVGVRVRSPRLGYYWCKWITAQHQGYGSCARIAAH